MHKIPCYAYNTNNKILIFKGASSMMKTRHKGKMLTLGSCIGIVAPASACENFDYTAGIELLHKWGYKTKISKTLKINDGYLAGSDDIRASELNAFFADDDVDAILCFGGGYGCTRILDLLDYDLIRNHPKLLIGFSDITALHCAIGQNSRLVTIHGPMLKTLSRNPTQYTITSLCRGLCMSVPLGAFPLPKKHALKSFYPGRAFGKLIGGNLSVVSALCGTPYELKGENSILFLEDIGEDAYAIDRMLRHFWQNGLLKNIKGLIFGDFTHCQPNKQEPFEFTVKEVLQQYAKLAKVPTIYNFPAGHERTNAFLPLGVNATINVTSEDDINFFISEAHCKLR